MFMLIYMYICIRISTRLCMYECMYVCMHVCMHAWMDSWTHVFMHSSCIYVFMYVHTYLCMHAFMYVCTYVCIYVCIHISITWIFLFYPRALNPSASSIWRNPRFLITWNPWKEKWNQQENLQEPNFEDHLPPKAAQMSEVLPTYRTYRFGPTC